jgi:hypothetical protein
LRANEIPLGARIVAIADAYDAMINDRPYKRAVSHEQAVAELRRHAGTQFDPELVELFCDLYANHAPEPDPTALAMSAKRVSHGHGPLIVPDGAGSRRKRRAPEAADGSPPRAESQTMAPDGALGLVPDAGLPVARRTGNTPTGGRTDSAAG